MTDPQRVAIVTGGAGKLGSAIAARLLEDGVAVVVADVNADAAAATVAGFRARFAAPSHSVTADLGSVDSIESLAREVGERFGRLDIVVNNAAVNRRSTLSELTPEAWDVMSDVNLRAPAILVSRVLGFFKAQNGGSVVNIASRNWVSGGPVAYTTMKAGIVGMTRSFATELAKYNVTANAVAPSFIESDFTSYDRDDEQMRRLMEQYQAITPLPRMAEPRDVANAVAFLASPAASFITGEVLHVCGGAQLAPLPRTPLAVEHPERR
ncbi:SDR family oxidoreductase [Amycolatopsis sp. K13G38]|uniref:SDR family oxidoreductase n=1 Tax=Amycolatopsis acididurans TaxID=2724524 RepID=A0ABX1JDP1_9PSEU|nr:SDR family NAD(P)-dependent oxidoreductase [Amycolatopsis acididurans]NKQ57912.1 SDR family oxidoreductase [Amycolatopsis acididurans]